MTLYKDLPKGDNILTANDIVKYGSMVFSSCYGEISSHYHAISGIVYEADDFYTVLHSTIMACWKRASKGGKITMDELIEYLLDVEEYSLPKVTKTRRARGPGMKVDRKMYGYGNSTKAVLYSGLHDVASPVRDESSSNFSSTMEYRGVYFKSSSSFWTTNSHQDQACAISVTSSLSCESWRSCAIYASKVPWVNMLLDFHSTTVPSANFY
jgi:hypothetical protein